MFESLPPWVPGVALLSVVFFLFALASRLRRPSSRRGDLSRAPQVLDVYEAATAASLDVAAAPRQTPTPSPVPALDAPARVLTARENRDVWNTARAKEGLCRYCEEPATEQIPALVTVATPLLDGIILALGGQVMQRVRIVARRDPSIHRDTVCTQHHEIAMGHANRFLASRHDNYAEFVENKNAERIEFQNYGIDERMKDDSDAVKRRRREVNSGNVARIGKAI